MIHVQSSVLKIYPNHIPKPIAPAHYPKNSEKMAVLQTQFGWPRKGSWKSLKGTLPKNISLKRYDKPNITTLQVLFKIAIWCLACNLFFPTYDWLANSFKKLKQGLLEIPALALSNLIQFKFSGR